MSENRWAGARCTHHPNLPWTSDITPSRWDVDRMSAVCAGCPVLMECARYALNDAAGGFYAGVWLPWDKTTAWNRVDNRRRARTALRRAFARAVNC